MESFITKNGKKMRRGYTTGACAAAAAGAASGAAVAAGALALLPQAASIKTKERARIQVTSFFMFVFSFLSKCASGFPWQGRKNDAAQTAVCAASSWN